MLEVSNSPEVSDWGAVSPDTGRRGAQKNGQLKLGQCQRKVAVELLRRNLSQVHRRGGCATVEIAAAIGSGVRLSSAVLLGGSNAMPEEQ